MSVKPRTMPLNQVLDYLQHHNNAILHYSNRSQKIDLWTPNSSSPVPISLRRSIVKHSNDLEALMHSGHISLCPNANLHRKHYKYVGSGEWSCDACLQLDPEVSKVSGGSVDDSRGETDV